MKWEVKNRDTVLKTFNYDVVREDVVDFSGKSREFHSIESHHGSVMIVPIKMNLIDKKTSFVMVSQYRHPIGMKTFEFPAGGKNAGESSKDAALRELKEETGYTPKSIKFFYSMFPDSSKSAEQLAIYLALVEGEPESLELDDSEEGAGLEVVEFTADDLHKLILDNEMVSGPSMAALLATMLQGRESVKYLNNLA